MNEEIKEEILSLRKVFQLLEQYRQEVPDGIEIHFYVLIAKIAKWLMENTTKETSYESDGVFWAWELANEHEPYELMLTVAPAWYLWGKDVPNPRIWKGTKS